MMDMQELDQDMAGGGDNAHDYALKHPLTLRWKKYSMQPYVGLML